MVIHPFGGTPAYKAGIRPGDLLMEVNDKRVDDLNTTEVADMLKGPKGTKVQVTVRREGATKPIAFNLIRDEIPRNSVDTAFWVKPGIAYMRIQSFTETTSHEVDENLKSLGEQNIKGLILDLARESGRPADRRRGHSRPLAGPGTGSGVAQRTCVLREALRSARQPIRGELPDSGSGKPLLGIGRGDRGGRAAGS